MIISLASLLIWGWLNQNWLATAVIFLLIVSHLLTSWRWALKTEQFYRIGDFVTALFVLSVLFFSFVQTEQRPVFIILEWLPAFFLPILLVQLYSINNQLPVGTLFYSMRKREQINYLDFKFPYATICLLGAGATADESLVYFAVSIAMITAILWTVHSKNSSTILWFSVISLAAVLSFWGQQGVRELQTIIEEKSVEWLTNWQTDPFKSTTSIGDLGELKLSDRIEFRVKAKQPMLLLQSSYDRYLGQTWIASARTFSDKSNYSKAEKNTPVEQLDVFQSHKRTSILALPSGTVSITGLEGGRLQYTPLGAVKLTEAPGFINYQIAYTGKTIAKIRDFDLQIPTQHLSWITETKKALKLEGQPPSIIAITIKQYFQENYLYSLFLGKEADANKALEIFMLQRKAGHCEYFAVATTLLLRSYGIPARLANGYSMQEYSELEQMYIVRRRHAHAWAIANIKGSWQEIDSTPSQWLDMEEEEADIWQPLSDFFSSLYFKYKQWRYQQSLTDQPNENTPLWLSVAALLSMVLAWRLYVSRQQLLKLQAKPDLKADYFDDPGKDSELYLIEQALTGTGRARLTNEGVTNWAERINDNALMAIGKLHYQYRFDNAHFSAEDRARLALAAQQWLENFNSNDKQY